MPYYRNLNLISGIIILSIMLAGAVSAQSDLIAEEDPVLARIIINGDSIIDFSVELNNTDLLNKRQMIFDFRHNNLVFEFASADTLVYMFFLRDSTKTGAHPG